MSGNSKNSKIVTDFCNAFARLDVDELMGFFTQDAVYTNIPMDPPNAGAEAIRKALEGFATMSESIAFEVHHQAENPQTGVVLNERTDKFVIGGRNVAVGVMGVFELRDGKICAWRDYFDLAQFQSQLAG